QGRRAAVLGARDVRRDNARILALLDGAEDVVGGRVEDVRIVAGENEGRVPVEAVFARARLNLGAQELRLAGAQVTPEQVASLTFRIDDVGIMGIDPAHEAVAALDELEVRVGRSAGSEGLGRAAPAAVV